jgi:dUTP pyrophosphatase
LTELQFQLKHNYDKMPIRAHEGDAGIDLFAASPSTLFPGVVRAVSTGVSVAIPDGMCGLVLPRSSMGQGGIIIPNSPGLIDSGYRGEIKVLLKNISDDPYKIQRGDRIAQLVIMPVLLPQFVDLWNDTERGTGGFGSTGT